jgi:hypothetical protein
MYPSCSDSKGLAVNLNYSKEYTMTNQTTQKPYSLAEGFEFPDVESILASVPATRKKVFDYMGISEQCYWDWKRTNRISVSSKEKLKAAQKYFKSEEYLRTLAVNTKALSEYDLEDFVAELTRRGLVVELNVRISTAS